MLLAGLLFVIGLAIGLVIGLDHRLAERNGQQEDGLDALSNPPRQVPPSASAAAGTAPPNNNADARQSNAEEAELRSKIRAAATAAQLDFDEALVPRDLDLSPRFANLVHLLEKSILQPSDLFAYLHTGVNALACAVGQACARRPDITGKEPILLSFVTLCGSFLRNYLLRAVARDSSSQARLQTLVAIRQHWMTPIDAEALAEFLQTGENNCDIDEQTEASLAAIDEDCKSWVRPILQRVGTPLAQAVLKIFEKASGPSSRFHFGQDPEHEDIAEFVRFPNGEDAGQRELTPTQRRALAEMHQTIQRAPARSMLLVGEAGVGKSTVTAQLTVELVRDGWTVISAGASQIIAGQSFMGQLENRIRQLLETLAKRPKSLWIAEDLQDFAIVGKHQFGRASLLDHVLPYIERGQVRLLAPIASDACENLLRMAPQLRSVCTTIRLPASPSDEALQIAQSWIAHQRGGLHNPPLCRDELLGEVHQHAMQHMPGQSLPGSLMRLLALVTERIVGSGERREATHQDVLATMSAVTGLPIAVLDERDPLDLDALRKAFSLRVMGQPEAVDGLVERIAMLKSGLCDPRRPIGVFLFTGPTGTGKTELCRALAEYLFGSSDRMLRLDMSEFQHPESIARLLGDNNSHDETKALVHRIREQPFQVVLLDEIEKAHPMIHDLFLQVFDEGRMTDRRGAVADFRHAIIIATSNVGVRNMEGSSLGFGDDKPDMMEALEQVFRREFLNRIDRIVVFRSLNEATLREVLLKELELVLQRRGLRRRPWAVEWDESALRFLLAEGWSPTLGARPLRRAIERHVLAPLAAAIVGEDMPSGDQFLFVTCDGSRIQVSFVSPDAPPPAPRAEAAVADVDLRTLARQAIGTRSESMQLQARIAALATGVASESWRTRRAMAFAAMEDKGFWSSPNRYSALAIIEVSDRIATSVQRSQERVNTLLAASEPPSAQEIRALAARAMLLDLAMHSLQIGAPQDAYVQVQVQHDPNSDPDRVANFAREIAGAYRAWAALRGMDCTELSQRAETIVLAISGFAAHCSLSNEHGLHVLEPDTHGGRLARVRVIIAPQPTRPADSGEELAMAHQALSHAAKGLPAVVRRYRSGPSPEIRDRVRGWHTGRWDRVMGGEFDVMG
jgi:ATP-dependent Clp protease ATP-binding subunit ClpC